jgi:hypothetical protein
VILRTPVSRTSLSKAFDSESGLKSLVTEPTITIEPKYFQPFQVPNVLHILMASNNDWVVPAGHGSRRYAVYQASDARIGDFGYFNRLNAALDAGGVEAMLWDMLRLDLGDYHPKQIYETDALLEQKQLTLHGLDAWVEALLQEGVLPNANEKYPNRSLTRDLVASARKFDPHTNDSEVPRTLQKLLGVTEFSNGSARGWRFLLSRIAAGCGKSAMADAGAGVVRSPAGVNVKAFWTEPSSRRLHT